jgi:hypothetical protein
MAQKDDTGKEQQPRPGEPASVRRPYATIDVKATEIEKAADPAGKPGAPGATAGAPETKPGAKPGTKPETKPETKSDTKPETSAAAEAAAPWRTPRAGDTPDAGGDDLARGETDAARVRTNSFLSHAAAGALGAVIVALLYALFGPSHAPPSPPPEAVAKLTKRLTDAELALGLRPGAEGLGGRLDDLARSTAALGEAQSRLSGEIKALEGKAGPGVSNDVAARVAKLEDMLVALQAQGGDGNDAARAAGSARVERDLAAVKSDAGKLGQRLDAVKSDLDERLKDTTRAADLAPLSAKLAALEQSVQGILSSEADRSANASRVVLSLELSSLKRVIERGEPYANELALVKKLAGETLDVRPLERYMREGIPTQAELARSFRRAANAMLDAEAEQPEATVLERLWAGARSIVRVRKAGHKAEEAGVEASIARMEGALKEGRLGDVLAEGKGLPPKAALAGEGWLNKVAARHAIDQALADIDRQLKASLGTRAAGTETR